MADEKRVVKYGDKEMDLPAGMTLEQAKKEMARFFPELADPEVKTEKKAGKTVYTFSKKAGTKGNDRLIEIESGVSGKTYQPFIKLKWGDQEGQLTPEEARAHALRLLECAESAETDAFIFDWLATSVGVVEPEKRVIVLREFRAYRESHNNG